MPVCRQDGIVSTFSRFVARDTVRNLYSYRLQKMQFCTADRVLPMIRCLQCDWCSWASELTVTAADFWYVVKFALAGCCLLLVALLLQTTCSRSPPFGAVLSATVSVFEPPRNELLDDDIWSRMPYDKHYGAAYAWHCMPTPWFCEKQT